MKVWTYLIGLYGGFILLFTMNGSGFSGNTARGDGK